MSIIFSAHRAVQDVGEDSRVMIKTSNVMNLVACCKHKRKVQESSQSTSKYNMGCHVDRHGYRVRFRVG